MTQTAKEYGKRKYRTSEMIPYSIKIDSSTTRLPLHDQIHIHVGFYLKIPPSFGMLQAFYSGNAQFILLKSQK